METFLGEITSPDIRGIQRHYLVFSINPDTREMSFKFFEIQFDSEFIVEIYRNSDGDWSEVMAGATKRAEQFGHQIEALASERKVWVG